MSFEIEGNIMCPDCGKESFISAIVPEKAWQPGGAYFEDEEECDYCGAKIEFCGRVESELEGLR